MTAQGAFSGRYARSVALLSWSLFYLAALLVVRVPFTGDQYFFADAARLLHDGGRLYLDIWDIKQPGIFAIYRIAAAVTDDVQLAVRLIELAAWALSVWIGVRLMRRAAVASELANCVPALAGASILLAAPAWHLSQVESFAVLPLSACLWFATARRAPWLRWSLVGAAAAVLAWLKLVYVLVPAAMSLAILVAEREWEAREFAARLLRAVGAGLLGFGSTLSLLAMPMIIDGSFGAMIEASLVYPASGTVGTESAPLTRLARSTLWLATTAAPLLLLAAFALPRRPIEFVHGALLGWLASAALCILAQRFSWWAYHGTLVKFPLGLLALIALRDLVLAQRLTQRRALQLAAAAFCLMLLPSSTQIWNKLRVVPSAAWGMVPPARYESALAPGYELLREQAEQFRARARVGATVCILGDPALSYLTGAKCPVALRYWSEPALDAAKWREMATELEHAAPDVVFLAQSAARVIEARQPAILRWLRGSYEPVGLNSSGDAWFVRRPDASRELVTEFAD